MDYVDRSVPVPPSTGRAGARRLRPAATPAAVAGPPHDEVPAGGVPAGGVPAGEVPAGEVPAGGVPAGEVPAGEVPAGEVPAGEVPTDLLGQLALLEKLAAAIASHGPEDGPASLAAEGSRRLVAVLDRLGAQRLAWLGRVEADGLWRADTLRTFAHWVAWREGRALPEARREALTAARLRDHLPATLRSARAGRLTRSQVDVLSRTLPTSEARCDELAREHVQTAEDAEVPSSEPGSEPGSTSATSADVTSWRDPRHDDGCTADAGRCTCERGAVTGEQVILGVAARFGVRDLATAARRFAHVADPEADDRGYRTAQEREHLDLSRTLGGYHLAGFLTEEHGQVLATALDAAIAVPSKDDGLRPTQRRAIALAGVARSFLDRGEAGGAGAGVRPHMTVLVPWRDFVALADAAAGPAGPAAAPAGAGSMPRDAAAVAAGPSADGGRNEDGRAVATVADMVSRGGAGRGTGSHDHAARDRTAQDLTADLLSPGPTWLDGSGPVPRQVLERIAADCSVTRVVFGPDSEVLDVGRAQRTFTSARRKAVVARDRACVWPGCDGPVHISEIHHARVHWADGGRTSTDNAALLCWFHHRHVDRERIAMAWRGRWVFSEPGGYDRPWDPGFPSDPGGRPASP